MWACHAGAYPVATSHIFIVLSLDEDTIKSPLGTNITLETLWSCPAIDMQIIQNSFYMNLWYQNYFHSVNLIGLLKVNFMKTFLFIIILIFLG